MDYISEISSPSGCWQIRAKGKIIDSSIIKDDFNFFSSLCQTGCKNYNKKYSCPPFSIPYSKVSQNYAYLCLYILMIELEQLSAKRLYNKIRMANVMLKSRLNKALRCIETNNAGTLMLASSSCNLCKPCQKKIEKPCKRPNLLRYSIESTGVDINKLLLNHFDTPLQWSWNETCNYNIVCGGILTNNNKLYELEITK